MLNRFNKESVELLMKLDIPIEQEIESTNKVAIAQAEAKRFANQVKAFEGARSVYKTRMKLETFQAATKGSRKYILSDPANRDVINLELQDQLRSDLLDVTVDSQE